MPGAQRVERMGDDEPKPMMAFLRILVIVLLAAVAYCALGYVFTRERRYLQLAWRLLVGGLLAALVFFAVMFVERLTAPTAALPDLRSPGASMVAHQAPQGIPEGGRVGRLAQAVEFAQRG